jgi:ATP-binding cassette subfamily C protein
MSKEETKQALNKLTALQIAMQKCKKVFIMVFAFSCAVNILTIITAFFSMFVINLVLPTGNLRTLNVLFFIMGYSHLIGMLIQVARSFALIKVGEWLDREIGPLLLAHSIATSAIKKSIGGSELLRQFQSLKYFATSSGIISYLIRLGL